MPEGDTVWRTARNLHRALTGRTVKADFRVPALATTALDALVLETVSRGKHLLTRFDSGDTLHTHLRMEGSWHLYRPGEKWRRARHEARVVLTSPEWVAVGFSLGIVELVRTDAEDTVVGHLGPDLLGPDWDPDEAVRRLAANPTREIADALLDQRNLAGVGNLYKSELCFLAGLHPRTPVAESGDLRRIVDRAHTLLLANRERVEQTTTGDLRRHQRHWVYRRLRNPCRRCGTLIKGDQQGNDGQERASFWCPACQPAPSTLA
jgi:endonuclease-8